MAKTDQEGTATTEPTTELSAVEIMRRQMDLEAGLTGELQDTRNVVERIQAQILAGSSDEEVFAAAEAGLIGAEDLIDVPLSLLDYAYNRSAYSAVEGILPVYAVVHAANLDTGEEVDFSIGAASAMAQLHRFEALKSFKKRALEDGGFPCSIKGKGTASGFTALFFRPLTDGERKRLGL